MLLNHSWMYRAFYFHYINKQNIGQAHYIRHASNNVVNLDDTRITFHNNGTFFEIDGGYNYPGTWNFTNIADTVVTMKYDFGTDIETVLKLTNNHFNYTVPSGYRNEKSIPSLFPLSNFKFFYK